MLTPGYLTPRISSTTLAILRVEQGQVSVRADVVATEEPLEIQLSYERRGVRAIKSISVTMRTPGQDTELAAGFLFSEGILQSRNQVRDIGDVQDPKDNKPLINVVRVTLADDVEVDLRTLERHFYTTSSCGVCGKTSLESLATRGAINLLPDSPFMDAAMIQDLPARLRDQQLVFDETGGIHAAALFDSHGNIITVCEDVGRHNAVDKVIGTQFLAGQLPLKRCVLLVSGRASFELVQKSVMAGIPILAAVGAPSSLAVDLARQFGATLVGFLRDGRFNVYAGAGRIREAVNCAHLSDKSPRKGS